MQCVSSARLATLQKQFTVEQQRLRRTGDVFSDTAMHVYSAKSLLRRRSNNRRAAAHAQDRKCPVGYCHACIQCEVATLLQKQFTDAAPARAQDLLADSNPMVVANAVAALAEIHEVGGSAAFHITSTSLFKLLRALNECTEWGQARRWPSMSASSWPP